MGRVAKAWQFLGHLGTAAWLVSLGSSLVSGLFAFLAGVPLWAYPIAVFGGAGAAVWTLYWIERLRQLMASRAAKAPRPDERPSLPNAKVDPIMLDDAIRYVANDSAWGREQVHDDPQFAVLVGTVLRDALSTEGVKAQGRHRHKVHGGPEDPALHPLKPIAAETWERAPLNAWYALNDPRVFNRFDFGEYDRLYDIRLNRREVETLWPKPAGKS